MAECMNKYEEFDRVTGRGAYRRCDGYRSGDKLKHVDIDIDVHPSLKGWTDNCLVRCKKGNNFKDKNKSCTSSVFCEVLGNGNCTECKTTSQKMKSFSSSLAKHPDIETGGYLLFLTVDEKLRKSPQPSVVTASALSTLDNAYWSKTPRNTPTNRELRCESRGRMRAASTVMSEFYTSLDKKLSHSWRPSTSKSVRFDTSSSSGQRASSSRLSNRYSGDCASGRVSSLSQEGWSIKQLEAWRLLAPTPPQIEVSQMNVSMYTPKELPGIKIFDESFFVI